MSKEQKLRIIPIGGLGEVGKNMMAYEYGGRILVVDAGLMFPDNDMLGVDYIIPDFQYLRDNATRVDGIFITHGHEDHIGAIQHLLAVVPAPVYATPLTRGLIDVKLARNGLSGKADSADRSSGRNRKDWTIPGGNFPRLPLHPGCNWPGDHHPGRVDRPHGRL